MNLENSIVNCSAYQGGRKIADFPIDAINTIIQEPETFVWVGLRKPDQDVLKKMQEEFGLHELAVEDANHAHQRPKLEEYGDTLFVVLYSVVEEQERARYEEVHVFVGPHFVLTVRHGDTITFQSVRTRCENLAEKLGTGPGYVLYSIIDFVVDQYQPYMDRLHDRLRILEERLFDPTVQDDSLKEFYRLKNDVLSLEAAAIPLVDICTRLLRFHSDIIPKENRIYYRDILDHVARVTQGCERMREMINAAMQIALAQVTIRQNEVVKRLAGWGAIIAIPTMVFSLYGMNFEFMPELRWRWAYPTTLVAVIVACFGLHRRLKRIGWV